MPRPLPDDAKTVFHRAGKPGLAELVKAGLLARGEYECPVCDGTRCDPGGHNERFEAMFGPGICRLCLGSCVIIVGGPLLISEFQV